MWLFSKAFPMMMRGDKIRHKNWPQDYYIYLNEEKVYDSNGNLFIEDIEYFLSFNKIIFDAAGTIWELYDDDYEAHL